MITISMSAWVSGPPADSDRIKVPLGLVSVSFVSQSVKGGGGDGTLQL